MTDDLTPPHWGSDPITGPAEAWNTWWASVSTGAIDKHMQTAFLAGYEAAEARAREEGAKAMQARRKYPVLGTQGQAKVDWQFVEDHAKQAYENHRQTVERLAERGGLSWCELCAVVQDRKWSKMETADAIEQVRAAEARYLAALDPAQITGGGE